MIPETLSISPQQFLDPSLRNHVEVPLDFKLCFGFIYFENVTITLVVNN